MGGFAARARRYRKAATRELPPRAIKWRPRLEVPHEGQAQVLAEAGTYNVLCMGRRWGKTRLGVRLCVEPMMKGYPVAWLVPAFEKASDIWTELVRALAPVIRTTNANLWEIDLVTGGSIKFYSIDRNPNGPRGKNFRRVIVDEAAFSRHLKKCLEDAVLPTMVDDPKADLWILSSPQGKNFFYELWQRGQEGPEKRAGWKSWRKPSKTNPHLSQERLAELRSQVSERKAKIEYDADFDSGGIFFDDWEETRDGKDWHVCTPFAVPDWWLARGGMDFGKRIFSWHLLRIGEDGRLFFTREVYLYDKLPSEQAKAVKAEILAEGLEPGSVTIYADPSGFPPDKADKRVGEYPVEAFWAEGLKVVKAENGRFATNTRAMEWLHEEEILAEDAPDGEQGKAVPVLRAFRGKCSNLCRTIPLMQPLEDDPDDFDSDLEDHAVDSGLRYALPNRKARLRSKRPRAPRVVLLPPMPGQQQPKRKAGV